MRRFSTALCALLLASGLVALSSCSPPPKAAYAAPVDREAMSAYRRTVLSWIVEGVSSEAALPKDEALNAFNYRAVAAAQQREMRNNDLRFAVKTLDAVHPHDCAWSRFDPGSVGYGYHDEFGPGPAYAYRCTIEVTHDNPRDGLITATTQGFFFRKDEQLVFVGPGAKNFKKA